MNYESSNFGSEGNWNENVKKGLKVEIILKIQITFLSYVNSQNIAKVKLY